MDTPGIDIRPLQTMEGTAEFCEVFFDDVRVPVANRVGDENDGWRVAMVTLSFERGTAFVSDVLESMELVRDLAELAKKHHEPRCNPLGGRRVCAARSGASRPSSTRSWALTKRNISQAQRTGLVGVGRQRVQAAHGRTCASTSATSPCACSTARRCRSTTSADLPTGEHVHGRFYATLDDHRRRDVAGEQRNIVGERVLGLPKDR